MDNNDNNILGAILAAASAAGAVEIGIPVAAPGILGAIGFTTTATVTVPAAVVVGVVGGLGFVAYKGYKHLNHNKDNKSLPSA